MVDPNRKINRLSDDDAAFLVECEQEFRYRYTDADDEFVEFCSKLTRPPPIIEPWQANRRSNTRGGGGNNNWNRNNYRPGGSGGGDSYNRNNYQSNNYNKRPYNRNHGHHPYEQRNFKRDGDGGSGSSQQYRSNASPY